MAVRYRLHPNDLQVGVLHSHCSETRFLWNLALEQFNLYDRRWPTRRLTFLAQRRQLKDVRAGSFLSTGSSSVQQVALQDFEQAVKNWWKGTHRRPTWRKRGIHEGFCIRDVRIKRLSTKWAAVHVPKCGYVRFRLSRPLPETHGMARVTLDRSGRWHVAFSAPQPAVKRKATGASTGIDMGIASTITQSDGTQDNAPGLKPNECNRRLRLERQLARQIKGSNRRARTKLALARLAAREADRVNDWREKATTRLVVDYDFIAIEILKVRKMMGSAKGTTEAPGKNVRAKSGLNRAIARQGWSAFALRLEQKGVASGVTVVRVPAQYTSLRCNVCAHTSQENRESQAVFHCQSCGNEEHADVNAAKNILAAGLAVSGRGGSVRPIAPVLASGRPDEASTPEAALVAA